MTVFVGCDLGTMGTKAAVVDLSGQIVGEAFEEVPLRTPRPRWAEQDLEEIEASAYRTIGRALEASGRARDVGGVAFSGQMSGIGTIDADFRPATHFDSWLDSRCTPYIDEMSEHAARVVELSGCPPTYSHGPKIVWWQRERPDDFKRIERFVVPGAFVAGRMCGLAAQDAFIDRTYLHFSNLSDTAAATWSDELIDEFRVDRRVLPRIVDPLDIVGEITPQAAEATGLPVGTPVAAGAGDQSAASLGAGVVSGGQAFDSAGTASVFAVCTDGYQPDTANLTLTSGHSVIAGKFIALAFINGGGLALRWFRDEIATDLADSPNAYAELDRLAGAVEPGCGGLLWFPHFQGGVLPPQPRARGAWVGLTAGHERGHMFRALLEGIAYEYAVWAELARGIGQDLHEARALGGGAASPLWNGIKADVLGIDWVPTLRQEGGVLADALIAAAATGHVDDLAATAQEWQETTEPIRPDPDRHATYWTLRTAYNELRNQLGPVYARLGSLVGR
ncbi:xylulose kinase [Actinobacteria bacterium YIM 96077]|uniref:Xylulose kinase n=1 Tax=Phytoactinopolyspora halophila TaxID=1981511 RepID=A0A329QVY3_9ACTN|nr:FGGY family carbohydrate kinase [Phytoactinopolyspora halophila]AYY15014.1 xylulose kinase [Actinobacteria bacterium YIM 96077]RAW15472.1 xylulose kinase [Phytoactinopolyspora halophila]